MSNFKLYELILDFAKKTIICIEASLYKTMGKFISNKFIKNLQINFCIGYFNDIYKALVLNSNKNITNKFIEIHNLLPNSFLCLLNITFNLTNDIIQNINRTNFNTNSYEEYIDSINKEFILLNMIKYEYIEKIILKHVCIDVNIDIDIKKNDPNKRYFNECSNYTN